MGSKQCKACLIDIGIDGFYKQPRNADGLASICKKCWNNKQKARLADPVARAAKNAANAAWRSSNRARHREMILKWRAAHPEKQRAAEANWRRANRDRVRKSHDKYVKANAHKVAAKHAANNAVSRGELTQPSNCERCGADVEQLEKHHHDYSKPLDVQWLCKSCHTIADKERRLKEAA